MERNRNVIRRALHRLSPTCSRHFSGLRRALANGPRGLIAGAGWAVLVTTALGGTASAANPRSVTAASPVAVCLKEAQAAESRFDPVDALRWYLQADRAQPNDPAILRGLSKAYSDSTLATPNAAEKKRRIEQALACAQHACLLEPRNAVNQLSLAVCYGKLGLYAETRDKIEYARLVKRYAEQALALDPNYAYAYHVLGQWNYEVASLGRTKRFLVSVFYGGLPPASTADAVRELERAVALEPGIVSHRLALGYAYRADGQPDRARQCFEQVLTMPKRELYDDDCRNEARACLAAGPGC